MPPAEPSAVCWVQDSDDWASVAAATGWSVEDCLNFKLAFKKRDDAKTVKDAMGAHFKRLRAVGWHLHKLATRSASPEATHRASFALQLCLLLVLS